MDLVSEEGCVLVLEYETLSDFRSMNELEGSQRMHAAEMFSASVLHCLPVSKVQQWLKIYTRVHSVPI
jgi:hypothetical protein